MSDVGFSQVGEEASESAPPGAISAGTMMRHAREAAGLHVAALAVSMKIPVKKLEALEADRLDLLHDAVFVRALAASVCRALKIDPAPILNKLPLNSTPQLKPDERGINAPFHAPSGATGISIPELLTKPSSLFVLALVVAGIAVFFFPDIKMPDVPGELASQTARPADTRVSTQAVPSSVESNSEPVAAPAPLAAPLSVPAAAGTAYSAEVPVVKLPSASSPPVAAIPTIAVASRPMAPTSQALAAASRPVSAPVLPSTGIVVFKAKGPTWVKVVDGKGMVQLSKTLAMGEVVGASGAMPLSVVIGRVDATDVEVRGQPFSLTGVSKDNVARFEVK